MSYDETLQDCMSQPTWPERFARAQWWDDNAKNHRNWFLSSWDYCRVPEISDWNEQYPGWENGVMDDGDIMRFIRGGVVKKIYDDYNAYPENARYTFRVAVYTVVEWPEGLPYWDMRILPYAECQQLGFNSITGTSDIYPFINVGTSAEYLEISNGYKKEMEKRRQSYMADAKAIDTSRHWKYVKKAYLNSTEWKKFAWRVRMHYKQTCQRCGATNCRLDVHHHSGYEMIGRETFDDVAPLCRSCHADEHGITEVTQ